MTNYWRRVVSVITAAALAAPAASSADQKITLRSGATLHGVASMDGEVVVVAIGESEVRVAFDSIASIQPDAGNVFTAPVGRGTELLLLALEGKVHEPGSGSSLGLLTEAYQVSPDDPRVAYWYASDLVAKGYGESASEVFRKNREGIEGHYPALSRKLAERIERRLAFEELPADLVERVDTINRGAAGLRPSDSRDALMHAYFRVVDQDGQPVSRDDFRVSVSGNNEELEGFGRGYYLFSYTRGSSSTSPCTLRIQGAGLKPAEHEFTASPWGVKDAGTFAATRFTERDLLELTTRVVDAQGAPVSDASVTLRRLANGATEPSNAVTDDQGEAAFQVYPGRYSASPHASGFKSVYKTITVSTGQDAKIKIELHNAISARLRVEWKSVPTDGDDPSLTGEEQLQIKDGVSRPSDRRSQWIGLAQIADKLTLAPGNAMYGRYGRAPSAPNWIGVARPESADESPRELYDSIDLDSIESWRAKSKPPAKVPPRQYANDAVEYYQVSPGDVVVGVTAARDPNTNRVIQRWYKGLVEALPE